MRCALVALLVLVGAGAYAQEVELAWTDNSPNATNPVAEDGFRVERSLDAGATWAPVGDVGQNVTTFVDASLAFDQGYCWRVRAFVGVIESAPSNVVCKIVETPQPEPPTPPGGLTITVTTRTTVSVE